MAMNSQTNNHVSTWATWACLIGLSWSSTVAVGQEAPTGGTTEVPYWQNAGVGQPETSVMRVAQLGLRPPAQTARTPEPPRIPQPAANHPLVPAIEMIRGAEEVMAGIQDYQTVFIKRERLNGRLGDYEYLFMKFRQKPFSVYIYFLKPDSVKGKEVLYVDGRNNGNLLAHSTGVQALFGTVALNPTSDMAMQGNRYPITTAGLSNLLKRSMQVSENDIQHGEIEVQMLQGAKVDGRPCTCVQVVHPIKRAHFQYHLSRAYYDDEYKIPVRNEVYDWPAKPGDQPVLLGEYTYTKLEFNRGFTDHDFDPKNKSYKFE